MIKEMNDSKNITKGLIEKGLTKISSSGTKVRGFRNFTRGDFYCKTERTFGAYHSSIDKAIFIHFDNIEKVKPIILDYLMRNNIKFLYENNSYIVIQ